MSVKKEDKTKNNKNAKKEEELSEEDLELQTKVNESLEKLRETNVSTQKAALDGLLYEIRSATASMTSVPKPLKFLRPHYDILKEIYGLETTGENNRPILADIISILATTKEDPELEALKYRLLGSNEGLKLLGHEYIRQLGGEIIEEANKRREADSDASIDDLLSLVREIVPYHMSHTAEPEAVDLLLELEHLEILQSHVDEKNCERTCLYLTACSSYLPAHEGETALRVAYRVYMENHRIHDAMRIALRLADRETIEKTFVACTDMLEKKQLCYLLARQGINLDFEDGPCALFPPPEADEDDAAVEAEVEEQRAALTAINSNGLLSKHFLTLARDLDVMDPKTPEDVYKFHLAEGRGRESSNVESARMNLASSFVNGFVNLGFCRDKLMFVGGDGADIGANPESQRWLSRHRELGKMSAVACMGLVSLWDVEGGLAQVDKYLYSHDNNIVAGAMLAIGVVNCNVRHESDPAFALLSQNVAEGKTIECKIASILGLGLAYVGTCKADVLELLTPLVGDPSTLVELAAAAALALGLVFVGEGTEEVAMSVLGALMLRSEAELVRPAAKQFCLALGLLFLGRREMAEPTLEVVRTIPYEPLVKYCSCLLEGCAHAGGGDVLVIQRLLAICGEHSNRGKKSVAANSASPGAPVATPLALPAAPGANGAAGTNGDAKDPKEATQGYHRPAAVLGIALVASGEPLGMQMASRALEHMLQYGDASVRRTVPLAFALLYTSNPDIAVIDLLTRLTHDADFLVSRAAILALGIVGAGTNNARLANYLRQLGAGGAEGSREASLSTDKFAFTARVALGLLHMGKGLVTLDPFHTDGQLLSRVSMAGLLVVLASTDEILSTAAVTQHHLLVMLAAAARPRMLLTLDEDGEPLPVTVRVGQGVDVTAQAGKPKTITGLQTHTTPVLLAHGERAELATPQYLALSPVLEGQVILKKNPDYVE